MDAYEFVAIVLALIIVCPRIMRELYPNSAKKKEKFSIKSLVPKFKLPGTQQEEPENKEKEEDSDTSESEK